MASASSPVTADRVVTGSPEHPDGTQSVVSTSLPKLDDGTYVVTWRVISADSHPVEGAYTFQVGPKATLSKSRAQGVADSLLASTGGSKTVGVVYGIDRAVLFAGLALLIGGVVFLVAVWSRGRDDRRAARLVWGGWIAVAVTTVLGIALEGVYGAGLPLDDVFDSTVLARRPRHALRQGRARAAGVVGGRGAAAAGAVATSPGGRAPVAPVVEGEPRSSVGAGLAVTPGIAGHAGTGIQTGLAIPADLVHVAAMACWLGGLLMLCVAVLPRRDVDELRRVLPRYSALALGAIVALVVSGAYQAWRQVGSIDALKSTDYGKLLIAKLVAFAALIVAAAFSREVVNRRFRGLPLDDAPIPAADPVLVGVGASTGTGGGGSGGGGGGEVEGGGAGGASPSRAAGRRSQVEASTSTTTSGTSSPTRRRCVVCAARCGWRWRSRP